MSGVVSPGMVWCYKSDGRIELGHGLGCSPMSVSESNLGSTFAQTSLNGFSGTCVDDALFRVGPNQSLPQYDRSFVSGARFLSSDDPHLTSDPQLLICFSKDDYQISARLSSLRSTILLI